MIPAGISLLLCCILFFHLWQIDRIPQGLFQDEGAIGYNALLLARTGFDEHQRFLPLYFESFGDFKSPVYIYTAALFFKIFGPSLWLLRLTSFFFFIAFLTSVFLLINAVAKAKNNTIIYALFAAGFFPWFFTISRVSFEVISQLAVMSWALLLIFRAFEVGRQSTHVPYVIVAGLLVGLSVYTYPTARLLGFLAFFSVLACYCRKASWERAAWFSGAFILAIIPHLLYSLSDPGALTARFKGITYIYDASMTPWVKVHRFFSNYGAHFGVKFLLLKGDGNLRHATGKGGEVFIGVFILYLIGLFSIVGEKRILKDRFSLLLLINLLFAPAAAALTNDGVPHALRSAPLGLFILLLSCYGFDRVLRTSQENIRQAIILIVFLALSVESTFYLHDYFGRYVTVSRRAFESYDLESAIDDAIKKAPSSIIISHTINEANARFLTAVAANPRNIHIEFGSPTPRRNACILFDSRDQHIVNQWEGNFMDLSRPDSAVRMRCF